MTTSSVLRALWVPAALFAFALVIRWPFFFPAVIDWDESTFILIGQSILDGHLPYTQLWDVKPPLLFETFAAAIAMFGHSVTGIRIAGTVLVAITAWITYLIARRTWTRPVAWMAAGLAVLGQSLIASGQATMSEHVMLPFLLGGVWLVLARPGLAAIGTAGALAAGAALVRLNVGLTVVTLGVIAAVLARRRGQSPVSTLVAYALGGLAATLVIALPFVVTGQPGLVWDSAISAALARAGEQTTLWFRFTAFVRAAFETWSSASGGHTLWIGWFLWVAMPFGVMSAWRGRREFTAASDTVGAFVVLFATMLAGVLTSGGVFHHYLIQLVPFAAVLGAALAADRSAVVRRVAWLAAAALAVASLTPVTVQYRLAIERLRSGQPLAHGRAYAIAAYIEQTNVDRRPVLILNDHVAYWLLRTTPTSPFLAHPSTLSREAMLERMGTSAAAELRRTFDAAPFLVVLDPGSRLVAAPPIKQEFDRILAEHYVEDATIEGRKVFRRVR